MSAGTSLEPRLGLAPGALRPLRVTSPAPVGAWEQVLASASNALPSQTPTWLRCVCTVEGYEDVSRLYETADGRRLVLPLVRRPGLGPILATDFGLPIGWGPGGLVCDGGELRPEDVRMVVGDLAQRYVLSTMIRPDPATAGTWEAAVPASVLREERMTQTVVLDGGLDEVWRKRFRSDTRNRIRRAERAGVHVECDDEGRLVPVFQQLYHQSVDRWARRERLPLPLARRLSARREPNRKLPTVAAMLGPRCRIYVAYHEGQPVAAIVVLRAATTAMYWRGAMLEKLAGPVYANYLLHKTAIADAIEAGCATYNMGDSARVSSLALFKSRFGAVSQDYASYRIERLPITPLARRVRVGVRRILALRPVRG
ncbi:GNAT family N-acetyltransferase [Micromonospora cremea]|uniref:Acetyltransferase (GNAT) domain-containing protein n=1 Tax=Micromonospora cremea TaxID=709881 RepID=A0A1N5TPF4_9ACTN|nr:GNAT family N-acetyltransferase [Micromonospora cremea]SIM50390.1 Acetyltransferase (GNAT) domain-containing protein [Micromonospora cremea]